MTDAFVQGHCDARFQAVADVFQQNFENRDELGASVALTVDGETVVDLWGGHCDSDKEQPWQEDTLCVAFSCTKAATAICAHFLVDRGQLDLARPVADYWPEFAANGKHETTVAMLLNHQAGLAAFRKKLESDDAYDWRLMVQVLEQQEPFWEPGTAHGYHMTSFGWLVGEVVRRVSGRSLGDFFREEIAEPFGLDFWIGLPAGLEDRLAPVRLFRPTPETQLTRFAEALLADRDSLQSLSFSNTGTGSPNRREFHAAQLGGHGGVGNARSIAGMFTPLATKSGALLSRERIDAMRQPVSVGEDRNLLLQTRFGEGFMLRMDNRKTDPLEGHSLLIDEGAFGHVGLGGSVGFADPDKGLAFGYAMNRHGGGILLNPRGQSLIDAAYQSLER